MNKTSLIRPLEGSAKVPPPPMAMAPSYAPAWLLLFATALLATASTLHADYVRPISAGYNWIANQLVLGGNTLDEVLPKVPEGSVFFKFSNAKASWEAAQVYDSKSGTWKPGGVTLSPGEGGYLSSPRPTELVFRGKLVKPQLPLTIPKGQLWLVSPQTPELASFETLVGRVPETGNILIQFIDGKAVRFEFAAGKWSPFEPTVGVGESVWIGAGKLTIPIAAPSISLIPQVNLNKDEPSALLPFSVHDLETNAKELIVTATPTDTALIPASNIVLGGSAEFRTIQFQPAKGRTGQTLITVIVQDSDGEKSFTSIVVVVGGGNTPPVITVPPTPQSPCPGGEAVFQVTATSATPIAYQWRRNAKDILGATGPSLSIKGVSAADTGSYSVSVRNEVGAVETTPVALDVLAATSASPLSDQTICPGGTVTFTTQISGSGKLAIEWSLDGKPIAGATTASLTITEATAQSAGLYCVKVTGACGQVTRCAVLRVVDDIPPQIVCPTNRTVTATSAAGAVVVFNPTATDNCGKSVTIDCKPASGTTFPVGKTTVLCTATDGGGKQASCEFIVEVLAPPGKPVITDPPKSQAVCVGRPATFLVGFKSDLPATVQWLRNGKVIDGATSTQFTIQSVRAADEGSYTVAIRSTVGSIESPPASLTLLQPPTLSPLVDQKVCPGNRVTLTTQISGVGPFKIEWIRNEKPILEANQATYIIPAATIADTGVYCVRVSNDCGQVTQCAVVTVADDEPPRISCPTNIVVTATSPAGARVTYAPTATDNCGTVAKLECKPESGSLFPVGRHVVVCTATDSSGKQASCEFVVEVLPPACCESHEWKNVDADTSGAVAWEGMASDTRLSRVVMFGGGTPSLRSDTLEWDGIRWVSRTKGKLGPREKLGMTFDSKLNQSIVFGGLGPNGELGDTWAWNGVDWLALGADGPAARHSHALAHDPLRQRTVLFGGMGKEGKELDDTWEFDGAAWKRVGANASGPGPRSGYALSWDGKQTVLFGGQRQGKPLGDTWGWDGERWKLLAESGPSPRQFAAMAWDPTCEIVVLFGGAKTEKEPLDDTWIWEGARWRQEAIQGPPALWGHAMAFDPNGRTLVLAGGQLSKGGLNSATWRFANDVTPPRLVDVAAVCGEPRVSVTFDEPLDPASAGNPGNYVLSCNGKPIAVVGVTVGSDGRGTTLLLSDPIREGDSCLLFVRNLMDVCGNSLKGREFQFSCTKDPCPRGSTGKEFWLTFPGNYLADPTHPPRQQVFITGTPGTRCDVSMPGLAVPFLGTFPIPAPGFLVVDLPPEADLGTLSDRVERRGVRVTADRNVSVYGYNHWPTTTDAYLGLPTSALGQTYMLMTYQNVFAGAPDLNGSEFAIVGTGTNTTVTIVPSADVEGHPRGVPFTVLLHEGETYQLRNSKPSPADLTGTFVLSDRPIAVFAGHACANIPNADVFFCNHIVEQLFPVSWAGREYLAMPLSTRTRGDTYRCLAVLPGTTVSVNGVVQAAGLDRGKFVEFISQDPVHITADQPILVAQFAHSSDFDGVGSSDPSMILLPPVPMYGSSYSVYAPGPDFQTHFLNIVAPTAAVGDLSVDGVLVPAGAFRLIGASGFVGAQIPVLAGPHAVMSPRGHAFGLVSYGWGSVDAYGYPAGLCGIPDSTPVEFQCPKREMTIDATIQCQGEVPDLASQVGNGGAATQIIQDPPKGTLLPPGNHVVKTTVVRPDGTSQQCETQLTVKPGIGLQCPTNIATQCTSGEGSIVRFEVITCDPLLKVACKPESGSVFKPGVTLVECTARNAAGAAVATCSFLVTVECRQLQVAPPITGSSSLGLSWTGRARLEEALSIGGPWKTIHVGAGPFSILTSRQEAYYRIVPE